jgi:hypothetical protein
MPNLDDGADAVTGDRLDYEVFNKLKNNWRAAAAPADPQPGMIRSDSGADKLFHEGAAGEEEVLQESRSADASPKFSGLSLKVVSIDDSDSPYSILASDYTIRADATSGAVTVNLPAATGSGRIIRIKKLDASANVVTLAAAAAETIDGAASASLTAQYSTLSVQDVAAGVWDIVPLAGAGSGASTLIFYDGFSDGSLGWFWLQDANSGTIVESGSVLTISVPEGVNCDWWSTTANGPVVYIPIFAGASEVIVKINSYAEGLNTGAGIAVCIGAAGATANVWAIEHYRGGAGIKIEAIQWGSAAAASAAVATLPIWLRVRISSGNNAAAGYKKITFGYSADGVTFTDLYTFTANPDNLALFARNWLDVATYHATAAPFEYIQINRADGA